MTAPAEDRNQPRRAAQKSGAKAAHEVCGATNPLNTQGLAELFFAQTKHLVFLCDLQGTWLEANPAAHAALHVPDREMSTRPLWELLGRPETPAARNLRDAIEQAAQGETVHCEVEIAIQGAENPSLFEMSLSPVRDANGQVVALLADACDVTASKQRDADYARAAAESLRQIDRRFYGMLEHAAIGIAHTALDGRYLLANQTFREMLGYTWEELASMRLQVLLHPDDWSRNAQRIEQLLTGKVASFNIEKRYRHKFGHYVWASVTVAVMLDERGEAAYLIAFATDLSQRKATEEQLRQLNETLEQQVAERTALAEDRTRQLRRLASELTQVEQRERRRLAQALHDHLQQLIAAARMSLSPVRKRLAETPHVERLRNIDELLEESIEVSRSLAFDLSPPVLHDAGMSAALTWLARHMQSRYELQVQVDADPQVDPTAEYTSVFLFQSVRELLLNVVKHAQAREATVVMSAHDAEHVRIVVRDQGRGFDPRQGRDHSEVEGFGLFSIRERLELLGGELRIESGIGQGTAITLIAPRHAPAGEPPARASSGAVTRLDLKAVADQAAPIRVLLVDDHKLVRQGLAGLLGEEEDILVIGEAADGLEAIELAQELTPDVIIMDVTMPHLDGVGATKQISARQPDVRIIGLSMHESDDLAVAMQAAGACDYLPKNGPLDQLTAAIRRC